MVARSPRRWYYAQPLQQSSPNLRTGYGGRVPPAVLYHGTARHNLDSIFAKGLLRGRRHHVHMSTNVQTMLAVGRRHGQPVVLSIDAGGMRGDGYEFYGTGNDVWLTEHVPAVYLKVVEE